ncbi:hypothetical protein [Granulicella sp. L60]|uniref:hypothetical protein n=1 Tax=Granulicella sp. L60 TaxID=1641866 RepID=UPI00131B4FC7|nr:hypothetical protein [Granulicella sp. L60]
MSVRQLKTPGKIAWIILLLLFLRLEFKAISTDRAENEKKQKEFFDSQREGFEKVTQQARKNFDQTAQGLQISIAELGKIMETTQRVSVDARRAMLDVTGGDSYAFVYPSFIFDVSPCAIPPCHKRMDRRFLLKIHNAGQQLLTDVRVNFYLSEGPEGSLGDIKPLNRFPIGSLAKGSGRNISDEPLYPTANRFGRFSYYVLIMAQNGGVNESIDFRPSKSGQGMAFRYVVRRGKGKPDPKNIATEKTDFETLIDSGWCEPEEGGMRANSVPSTHSNDRH